MPDEYDKTVCELMFEQSGQLTSRMHTEVRSKELQQEEVSYAALQYTMHINQWVSNLRKCDL